MEGGLIRESVCAQCGVEPESLTHLFWWCKFSLEIFDVEVQRTNKNVRSALGEVNQWPSLRNRGLLPERYAKLNLEGHEVPEDFEWENVIGDKSPTDWPHPMGPVDVTASALK